MPIVSASSGAAVEYYARISAEQENIKRQSYKLDSVVKKLNSKLDTFNPTGLFEIMYESDKSSSAFQSFAVNAVKDLVKNYNSLNDTIAACDRMTNEGTGLLSKVQTLLTGPQAEAFKNIGIEIDKYTGAIKFDEQKFTDSIAADPKAVRKLIMDNDKLGSVLQNVMSSMLSKPTTYYFRASFTIDA